MGTIQNSINQISGTLMGAAVAGKHLANQEKANELAKDANQLTANKELKEAEMEYKNTNEALLKNNDKLYNELAKESPDIQEKFANDLEGYQNYKADLADKAYNEARDDFDRRNNLYESGVQKTKPRSGRLDKAQEAFESMMDEIKATANLKFDYEEATTRLTNAVKNSYRLGGNK